MRIGNNLGVLCNTSTWLAPTILSTILSLVAMGISITYGVYHQHARSQSKRANRSTERSAPQVKHDSHVSFSFRFTCQLGPLMQDKHESTLYIPSDLYESHVIPIRGSYKKNSKEHELSSKIG
jgi:hypothetical protein